MYARDTALIATPVGAILVEGDDRVVTAIRIGGDGPRAIGSAVAVRAACDQIAAYFDGALTAFDMPLAPAATPRGAVLRQAIVDVGYGESLRYGEVARLIGSSARAIGQACRRNPFPLVVPCHRIIGGSGGGHYSAGDGLRTKDWLLDHERRHREQMHG